MGELTEYQFRNELEQLINANDYEGLRELGKTVKYSTSPFARNYSLICFTLANSIEEEIKQNG